MDPKQRETLMALNNPQQVVLDDWCSQAAAGHLSERQLAGSDDRFLVQPLQRIHRQGRDRYLLTKL